MNEIIKTQRGIAWIGIGIMILLFTVMLILSYFLIGFPSNVDESLFLVLSIFSTIIGLVCLCLGMIGKQMY